MTKPDQTPVTEPTNLDDAIQNRIGSSLATPWLVLLLYMAATVLMTLPLITQLGTHIPAAEGSDVWVHEWTFWWIEQAITEFKNPFYTDLLFHPTGVSLTTHNIAWFNIGLWFPLQAAVGNQVAYSLTYILVFTLNAFCMYLLTFAWTRSRSAAFVAGLIYGFWPYTFTQSGHPNMATIMWPPLVLFYLKRIANRTGKSHWKNLGMAGLFIALTGIARWQLLIVVSLLFGIYLLYLLFADGNRDTSMRQAVAGGRSSRRMPLHLPTLGTAARLAAPFLFAMLLMLPLAGPVVYTQITQDFPEEALVYEPWFGTPLLTYLIPNSRLGIYQSVVEQLPEQLQFHYQRVDFLGYTVLLLALVGILRRWRATWLWLGVALIYWVLALGPELTLAYERLPNLPMPYRLVENFPLVQIVRRPHRFNAFVALPLGLMAAYGMTVLLRKPQMVKNPLPKSSSIPESAGAPWRNIAWRNTVLTALASILILAEYRPSPYGLESTHIPNWYYQLAEDAEEFAIFGLPPSLRLADKYFMHYQILHEKPMVEGHISRPTYATFGFMDQSDYLWHLRIHRTMKQELVDVTNQLQLLVDANVRYLILHKALLTDEQLTQFMDWLTYNPTYEDDEVIVYHADPQEGRDFIVSDWLMEGLGLLRFDFGPKQVQQGEQIHLDARWAGRGATESDIHACIVLSQNDLPQNDLSQSGSPSVHKCFQIGGDRSTTTWQPNEIVRGDYRMQIPPLLEPSAYQADLFLVDSASRQRIEGDRAGGEHFNMALAQRPIGTIQVDERERQFTQPTLPYPSALKWQELVWLNSYNIERTDSTLNVTLGWQAIQRMNRSYKVFVHVVDVETGAMLAQNDSVPRQWTYPTTWWEANEFVVDTIELTAEDLGIKEVRILVGLYDEETGIRVPILDDSGAPYPDDAAVLVMPE